MNPIASPPASSVVFHLPRIGSPNVAANTIIATAPHALTQTVMNAASVSICVAFRALSDRVSIDSPRTSCEYIPKAATNAASVPKREPRISDALKADSERDCDKITHPAPVVAVTISAHPVLLTVRSRSVIVVMLLAKAFGVDTPIIAANIGNNASNVSVIAISEYDADQ